MSSPLTARTATRRYVGLTALRWLPVGLSAPVTVLLASARGLSPADIGVVLAVYSVVTLLLELPTGGLADALGHRLVLVLAGLLTTGGLLLLVVADSTAAFALAWALATVGARGLLRVHWRPHLLRDTKAIEYAVDIGSVRRP